MIAYVAPTMAGKVFASIKTAIKSLTPKPSVTLSDMMMKEVRQLTPSTKEMAWVVEVNVDDSQLSEKLQNKIYNIIDKYSGCTSDDFRMWVENPMNFKRETVYSIDSLIPIISQYKERICCEWEKKFGEHPGTAQKLKEFYDSINHGVTEDTLLFYKIGAYLDSLDNSSSFTANIKDSWNKRYIRWNEIYVVWFAMKMYDEYTTEDEWDMIAKEYAEGTVAVLDRVQLTEQVIVNSCYGRTTMYTFVNKEGVKFVKYISSSLELENKCKNEDNTYSFMATVTRVNNHNRTISLGGRIKPIKK